MFWSASHIIVEEIWPTLLYIVVLVCWGSITWLSKFPLDHFIPLRSGQKHITQFKVLCVYNHPVLYFLNFYGLAGSRWFYLLYVTSENSKKVVWLYKVILIHHFNKHWHSINIYLTDHKCVTAVVRRCFYEKCLNTFVLLVHKWTHICLVNQVYRERCILMGFLLTSLTWNKVQFK